MQQFSRGPQEPTRVDRRLDVRRGVAVPGRLVWRDARGATRFASIVTRDVSEQGVFIDCQSGSAIPLYRLVQLQLDREARGSASLPVALRQPKVLSAVYRLGPRASKTGVPQAYALRLLVEPAGRRNRLSAPAAPHPRVADQYRALSA